MICKFIIIQTRNVFDFFQMLIHVYTFFFAEKQNKSISDALSMCTHLGTIIPLAPVPSTPLRPIKNNLQTTSSKLFSMTKNT